MPQQSLHTVVIGDVHGRADLLDEILWGIKRKAERQHFPYRIVFIGDIIDRGPDSSGAMDLVNATLKDLPGSELILGNHDWLLLRILEHEGDENEAKFCSHWTSSTIGGMDTLRSYGFPGGKVSAAVIRQFMDPEHISCFRCAKSYLELEHHILVHAGLRPGVPLSEQSAYEMSWIRTEFLSHPGPF